MLGPGEEKLYHREWNLTYESGDPVPPGIYQVSTIIKASSTIESDALNIEITGHEQDIPLRKGWNFISLPCIPVNSDLSIVLKSIWPYCRSVWTYDSSIKLWFRYVVSNPYFLNNLKTMEIGKGYWVEVSQDVILNIVGKIIQDPQVQLIQGWNFVGFNSADILELDQAMSSILYGAIYTYDSLEGKWAGQMPAGPTFLSKLTHLEPGRGYCIHVNSSCIWNIRDSGF